ncbi:MAG: hypothetical protein ACXWLM_01550 [Myxococcales bacterium]
MRSRRELLVSMASLWLARAASATEALRLPVRDRLRRLDELSRALAHREIQPIEWQRQVEALARGIDLAELCRLADFDRVVARLPLLPKGTSAEAIQLLPGQHFTPKIFAMGKGRAIIPHGHVNMVSHHLVLTGELHGRHWERLRDEERNLVLRPTIDKTFRPGDSSSISDQRDNAHWFVATSGKAYTLDCIVDGLDSAHDYRFHIDFIDPDRAQPLGDGTVRVPRLELDECLRRYG